MSAPPSPAVPPLVIASRRTLLSAASRLRSKEKGNSKHEDSWTGADPGRRCGAGAEIGGAQAGDPAERVLRSYPRTVRGFQQAVRRILEEQDRAGRDHPPVARRFR